MDRALAQLRSAKLAIFELSLPGRKAQPAGVLLWDENAGEWGTRFRRDFHLISDAEDLEVLVAMERDIDRKIRDLGPKEFLRWATDTLSNAIRIGDPESVAVESMDRALARLYRRHVPAEIQRYETHLPRVALAAAAGSWSDTMSPETFADAAEDWIETPEDLRIDDRMFIAEVAGRSMEPKIPDGSLCVFRYSPAGSRRGRLLLIENFSDASQRYTVKRYTSEKEFLDDGSFRHKRIRLEPLNPEFEPWELNEGEDCRVIAEFVRVLDE